MHFIGGLHIHMIEVFYALYPLEEDITLLIFCVLERVSSIYFFTKIYFSDN